MQPEPANAFLTTAEAFGRFIEEWEACVLPKSSWTHAAHVAVGACYLVRYGDEAYSRMRDGIRRYNTAVGTLNTDTSGYHETLTRFWLLMIERILKPESGESDAYKSARKAVECLAQHRNLFQAFYSFDVVRSLEARRTWMPHDLPGEIPMPVQVVAGTTGFEPTKP